MFKNAIQASAVLALLAASCGAQAALCTQVTNTSLTTCFGQDLAPNGAVGNDPLAARDEFAGKLSSIGTETFLGHSPGNPIGTPEESPISLNFQNGITGTVTGRTVFNDPFGGSTSISHVFVLGNDNPVPSMGRFGTSGDGDGERFMEANNTFVIEFSEAISAFGFYATDVGDFGGSLTVDLLDELGNQVGSSLPVNSDPTNTGNDNESNLLFWGFFDTSNQYKGIRINFSTGGVDGMGFDDLMIGALRDNGTDPDPNPTPIPGTLLLAGLGLAGLGAMRRRVR